MEHIAEVGRVGVVLVLTLGGPLGALLLLNLRDRRQARLLRAVLEQVSSRELRGQLAVQVRSRIFSPRSRVSVHVLACSPDDVWEVMKRLSERLSPHVRLQVAGPGDRCFLATFTLQTTKAQRHPRYPAPSLAAT